MNTPPMPPEIMPSPPARASSAFQPWRRLALPAWATGGPLLRRWLPLLGAALLLGWLSLYFFSANWPALLQIKEQLAAPGAQGRSALLAPLVILVAQTLALCVAWGALLWLAIRESLKPPGIAHKKAGQDQPQEVMMEQTLPFSPTPQEVIIEKTQPLSPTSQPAALRPPVEPGQFMHFLPPSGEQSWPALRVPPAAPPQQRNTVTERRPVQPRTESDRPATPEPEKIPGAKATKRMPAVDEDQSAALERSRRSEDEQWEEDAQEQEEDTEFLAVLNAMGFLPSAAQQPGEAAGEKKPQPDQESKKSAAASASRAAAREAVEGRAGSRGEDNESEWGGSPYDVRQETHDAFQHGKSPRAPRPGEQEEQLATSAQEFIFGNPFEGPLPDVFQHDEDLKRALLEQKQTTARAPARTSGQQSRTDKRVGPRKQQ